MVITSPNGKLLLCMAIVGVAVLVAPAAAADLSCGQVSGSLAPCMNYLKGGVGLVPPPCCNGVRSLNSAAQTPIDRQTACKCLKSMAGNIKGINAGLAEGLPGQCGVSIPYKISPSTDCNSVN